MVGHFLAVDSDLASVRFLGRYARRLARVAVLRPCYELIREFRGVVGPSFYCRPKLVLDQDGVPFDEEGHLCRHPSKPKCGTCVAAMVLRLQFWPLRVWLLEGPPGMTAAEPARQPVSLLQFEKSVRRPAAESYLASRLGGTPFCIVDIRNRYSAGLQAPEDQRLTAESQRKLRRILRPQELTDRGPEMAFLRTRPLYLADWTHVDDVIAQLSLALLQFGIVEQDSDLSQWLVDDYLAGVHLKGVTPQKQFHEYTRLEVFGGAWRNWGDHDHAGAWLTYLRTWFWKTGGPPPNAAEDNVDTGEGPGINQPEAASPASPRRREAGFAVPRNEPLDPASPVSLSRAASVLEVSERQVRRLVKTRGLVATGSNPLTFAVHDIEALRDERTDVADEYTQRQRVIDQMIRAGKERGAARKAEYRQRQRRQKTAAEPTTPTAQPRGRSTASDTR